MNRMGMQAVWATLAAMGTTLVAGPTRSVAQDAGRQAITIPAITFSGQGGAEVSRTEPNGSAAARVPEFIHFW